MPRTGYESKLIQTVPVLHSGPFYQGLSRNANSDLVSGRSRTINCSIVDPLTLIVTDVSLLEKGRRCLIELCTPPQGGQEGHIARNCTETVVDEKLVEWCVETTILFFTSLTSPLSSYRCESRLVMSDHSLSHFHIQRWGEGPRCTSLHPPGNNGHP